MQSCVGRQHVARPENVDSSVGLGDPTSGLTHQKGTTGDVPDREPEFEEGGEASASHVREIEGRGAEPSNPGSLAHHGTEHPEIRVVVHPPPRSTRVGNAGAHDGARQVAIVRNDKPTLIRPRASTRLRDEQLVLRNVQDEGGKGPPAALARDGDREMGHSVEEVRRPVERIDDETRSARAAFFGLAALFAQESVIDAPTEQDGPELLLRLEIGGRDEVPRPLRTDTEIAPRAEAAHEIVTRRTRRVHHDSELGGRFEGGHDALLTVERAVIPVEMTATTDNYGAASRKAPKTGQRVRCGAPERLAFPPPAGHGRAMAWLLRLGAVKWGLTRAAGGSARARASRGRDPGAPCNGRLRGVAFAAALALLGLGGEGAAQAHIILISDGGANTPKDWQVMTDTVGDPQKPTPCGSPSPSMPTNSVLTVQEGQSVTVNWTEIIGHSGHFRIVLAPVSPADVDGGTETLDGSTVGVGVLPDPATTEYADPPTDMEAISVLTHPSGTPIGSGGAIVLADGLFSHCIAGDPCDAGPVTASPKDYTYTVTMPNTPCTNCTLQVLQFMSYHGPDPSFFYHHCAAITILPGDGGSSSSGATSSSGSQGSSSAGASSGTGGVSGGGSSGGGNAAGSSGGTGGSASNGGGPSAGGSSESNGSSSGGTSNHNGGGCGIAAGAASVPAAIMALTVAVARRRRARRAQRNDSARS